MTIDVNLRSLTQSKRHAILGEIAVRVDASSFPGERWNDFVAVLLTWWCEGCVALLRGQSSAEFHFMDGPYQFNIEMASQDAWQVGFLRRRATSGREMTVLEPTPGLPESIQIEASSFAHSVASNADALIRECERRDWETAELDELGRQHNVLNSLLLRGTHPTT